jgi:hypothetical protein
MIRLKRLMVKFFTDSVGWMDRESLWERERMQCLKCWHEKMERGIKLARPSGPLARAGAGDCPHEKSPKSCVSQLSTVALKL